MGRPLNKKFFGNTNDGSSSQIGDNAIGGEGVASVTITNAGDYTGTLPTVGFDTPSIPTGIVAEGTVNGKLLGTTVKAAGGSSYDIDDTLTLVNGTASTTATMTVTSVITRDNNGIALVSGGDNNDVGDEYWLESTGWTVPLKVRVTAATDGEATGINVVQNGVWGGPNAAPTGNQSGTFHMGPGSIDDNGFGLVFSITASAYAINGVAVDAEGTYTAVPSNPVATTVSPTGGTGATLTAHWGVKSVTMTESGSGYISAGDAAVEFFPESALGTSVLTATEENAILGIDLETSLFVDIVKQESNNSYWVETDTLETKLLGLAAPTDPIGLYIRAEDSDGNYYWVKSLKAHLAVIGEVTGGGEFTEDSEVKWSFDAAEENVSVQIRNAV